AFLRSLAALGRQAGFRGLLVAVDNLDALMERDPETGRLRYTRGVRDEAYEAIRELVDDVDEAHGVLWLFAGRPAGLDDERAGIASTAVSEIFASGQNRIVDAFGKLLDAHHGAMAVEGGYGQGKTHLLKHLAQLARRRGCVVSLVPLSKETPFNHWWHVYAAAAQHARTPDGQPVEAVLRRHRWTDSALQELHAF